MSLPILDAGQVQWIVQQVEAYSGTQRSMFRPSECPAQRGFWKLMPITHIPQQSDECLPCCIAMVLDLPLKTVMSWFDGRQYDSIAAVESVLAENGYEMEKFDEPGMAGDLRRIICLANPKGEGHVVVMDEGNMTIIDPASKATNLFEMQVLGYSPKGAAGTFVIRPRG